MTEQLRRLPARLRAHAVLIASIVSGMGKLSVAVDKRGMPTLLWDIILGEEYDFMRNLQKPCAHSGLDS